MNKRKKGLTAATLALAVTVIAACSQVDIVISERQLPRRCSPRWLRLDRPRLAETGGLAINLSQPIEVQMVKDPARQHPWTDPPTIAPPPKWSDFKRHKIPNQRISSQASQFYYDNDLINSEKQNDVTHEK